MEAKLSDKKSDIQQLSVVYKSFNAKKKGHTSVKWSANDVNALECNANQKQRMNI